ncbi:MAG: Coenzyme F420 hydrogenase/dehydrogenase, beta subunit C-terminal domain [Methanofollis sp.]|nr:Coenzyme F420 hydrogenase/dehydrogenase, beta subunit C-terminal domain [Methanofollis sp.]
MTDNDIRWVADADLCTGCGVCTSMCPHSAIVLNSDPIRGIYLPHIDENRCTGCGICLKTCSGHEFDFSKWNREIFGKIPENILLGHYNECYVGYTTQKEIRSHASSGGIITSLLLFLLNKGIIQGAIITKMNKDRPYDPEPFIARTEEDILEGARSKYCPVPLGIILKEVIESKKEDKFALVGLPCHINSILKAESLNKDLKDKIILHIGLMCAHTNNFHGTTALMRSQHVAPENIKKIYYRGEGWPGLFQAEKIDGSRVAIPLKKFFDFTHHTHFFTPRRCLLCYDATSEFADLSVGDAWNLPESRDDKEGTSIILSRTNKGETLLQMLTHEGILTLTPTSPEKIISSQPGLIFTKKIGTRSRLAFLTLTRKKIPEYHAEFHPTSKLFSLYSVLLLINPKISQNSKLLDFVVSVPSTLFRPISLTQNFVSMAWLKIYKTKIEGVH